MSPRRRRRRANPKNSQVTLRPSAADAILRLPSFAHSTLKAAFLPSFRPRRRSLHRLSKHIIFALNYTRLDAAPLSLSSSISIILEWRSYTKSVGFCGADFGNVRWKLLVFTREQFYLWRLASCKSGTLRNRRIRNPPPSLLPSFPWSQFVFQSPSSSVVSVRGINPNRASVRASKYIHHGRGRCMLLAPLCIRFVRGGGREEPNYRLCRPWL